jgi:hypothetical protein
LIGIITNLDPCGVKFELKPFKFPMAVRFVFEPAPEQTLPTLADKAKGPLILEKWGLSRLQSKIYTFAGQLPVVFDPITFFTQFLSVPGVSIGDIHSIELETLTTNTVGNAFFKKLWTGPHRLVRDVPGKPIQKCMDKKVNDLWVSDMLQSAIVDDDSDEYEAFSESDRKELIFQLIKAVVIGGEICQYEDTWDVYEPIVTSLYKDLVGQSVVKNTSGAVSIVANAYLLKKVNGKDVRSDYDRSFCLLVVDSYGKKVRMLNHRCAV